MTDSLSRLMGGKTLLLLGMGLAGVLTFLQPVGARLSPYVLAALRIGTGLVVVSIWGDMISLAGSKVLGCGWWLFLYMRRF